MALAVAVATVPAFANAQEEDKPAPPERPERPERQQGRGGPGGARGGGGPIFGAIDANKDGTLSAEEIAAAPAALKKLDTDGDGNVTNEELRAQFSGGGGGGAPGGAPGGAAGGGAFTADAMVERMMQADTNGDGKVSTEEAPERMQRAFERGDTNGDGALDEAEIKVLAGEIVERFRGGAGGRSGGGKGGRGGKGGGAEDPAQPDKPKRPDFEES